MPKLTDEELNERVALAVARRDAAWRWAGITLVANVAALALLLLTADRTDMDTWTHNNKIWVAFAMTAVIGWIVVGTATAYDDDAKSLRARLAVALIPLAAVVLSLPYFVPRLHHQRQATAAFKAYTARMPVRHGEEDILYDAKRFYEICVPSKGGRRVFCANVRLDAPHGHQVESPEWHAEWEIYH